MEKAQGKEAQPCMISSPPTEDLKWSGLTPALPPDSPRKQIVSKLLDHSCKDIRKPQSDGWSSEDDDDDVFSTKGQEMASSQTGACFCSTVMTSLS